MMSSLSNRRGVAGFTLVELVIAVAVLAILVAIAVPSFQSTFRSNRVTSGANELLALFSYARSEAIRSNVGNGTVAAASVCASADGATCGGTWEDGWLVYRDLNQDGAPDANEILRYVTPNPRLTVTSGNTEFAFDNRGRRRPPAVAGATTITITPEECNAGQPFLRTVDIGVTGQVKVIRGNCT